MSNNHLKIIDLIIKIGAISLIGLWCLLLLRPFVMIILWSTILAVAFYPIFAWLKSRLAGKANLAAAVIIIAGIAIILGPVGLMAKTLAENVNNLAINITTGSLVLPPPPEYIDNVPLIGERLHNIWQLASVNLVEAIQPLEPQIQTIATNFLGVTANVSLAVLQFLVSIIISVFLMINAKSLSRKLRRFVNRLTPNRSQAFIELASSTLRNVIRGIIGVAAIQTFVIGIGFISASIPSAGLLTFICLIFSIVQIGPGIVILPTIIFAWFNMDGFSALIYTLWMIAATLVDNFLKPILMGRGLPIPMLVIFLGVIGGTLVHGIIGLFVGPVVLAFGYELLRAWVKDEQDVLAENKL